MSDYVRLYTSEAKSFKINYKDINGKPRPFQFENGVLKITEADLPEWERCLQALGGGHPLIQEVSRSKAEEVAKQHMSKQAAHSGGFHSLAMMGQANLEKRDAALQGMAPEATREMNEMITTTEAAVQKAVQEAAKSETKPLQTEEAPKPSINLFPKK